MEHTLAEQAFLLCYDLDKQRMARTSQVDYLVRTATLVELYLAGALIDSDGKAAPARGAKTTDPVLSGVLDEIGAAPVKSWKHWVRRETKETKRAVRARLVEQRVIEVRKRRIVGLFPHTTTTVRDTRAAKQVRASVTEALRQPASRIEPTAAALIALAAAADLGFVLDRRTRKEHKDRIARCTELAGPAAPALKKVLTQRRAAMNGGAVAAATSSGG